MAIKVGINGFGRIGRLALRASPVKEKGALNVVMGVNQHLFDPAQHRIVTAASCTTNCLAPVVNWATNNARWCPSTTVPIRARRSSMRCRRSWSMVPR